ncbi:MULTISPECIES: DUF6572 domain-containing protein [unclassified Pseudoalteromonas]|uniref:DUF6572 domain-containing protein n=1 Tax=unclassified Pseudoalteromonas TaxID=194690 RepID=UPI000CF7231B|nr:MULTISPECIES: DUF6572 domain-containing protein [unclassified Pseudoalteromonas]
MSITDSQTIDSVIRSDEHNDVVLLITDHLDWSEPQEHLLALQQKLNTYISFVESGQLFSDFPDTKNKEVSILIACGFEPVNAALSFFKKADVFLNDRLNIRLRYAIES